MVEIKYEIDDLDRQLIHKLSQDGRMSFRQLAEEIDVTEKTVRMRYKNLIDTNTLEVVGVVNPIALGLKAGAIIQIKLQSNSINQVIEELQQIQEVRYISLTSGEYPLLVQINVSDHDAITDTVLKITGIAHVTDINTIVQLDIYKNTFQYI
ncbi:Lrp/AsnC family transcriptional regulator, regulator for asnA, asnC and gidA [Lentibacillus halodurans]|uniref:Lrp/AsnC family transcriptional regulator, regulator for asnA, asnC and gidA n=1 Tax=Lentibacillus halodurans TaxID=237679 RepID=A0A1I1A5I2_9BACI|nr:Lrp/AsnC family transcriptional regulator [Lentibacillus halodurans]SFB33195.1 Lrp/AsnC family transcriptional regulator, regulator for asnA, asnC and gidA [Lentibacillus halodurans]